MRILVVGSGGREHALAWRLRQSPSAAEILAAPGNPGIAAVARCVPVEAADLKGLSDLVRREKVDLTVVGPEAPLAAGLVDAFREEGHLVFGPTRSAARLESSKAFAKRLMQKRKIPTADFRVFDRADAALAYVKEADRPLVVKADGLAAGKGVTVCKGAVEATAAIEEAMGRRAFGDAGARVVIEDLLIGSELSVMAVTDGKALFPLPPAQDHKRLGDGDTGPNTGGMGAVSPVPAATSEILRRVEKEILVPALHGMRAEGCPFSGLLYAGIMLTSSGPKVLEFNVRFGDPETQALMPRLRGDLAAMLASAARGGLDTGDVSVSDEAAVCVVACAAGYPSAPRKGDPIEGLDAAAGLPGVQVFHAGTALSQGRLVTSGGRVLGISGSGRTIGAARKAAYEGLSRIRFDGMQRRADIGAAAEAGTAA